jgi:hypothetical protein
MSVRQARTAIKTSDATISSPSSEQLIEKPKLQSPHRFLSRSSLVKIIFALLVLIVSLMLFVDYVVAEADQRGNSLEFQLAACKEREDRVWNMGYEAGEKLVRYRVSIDGQDGDSEAWAAWKEGFKAGEELGKRGVCERFRF